MDRRLPVSMAAVGLRTPAANTRKSATRARTRPSMTRVVRILGTKRGWGHKHRSTDCSHKEACVEVQRDG
eukprot:2647553-Lingulodinium_polyedra.AAC.1